MTTPTARRRFALASVVIAMLASGAGARGQAAPDEEVGKALAELRAATRPFQDLAAAVAAGYVAEVKDCIVHEHHGAMGYHHLNRAHLQRDLVVTRPQLLLYEKMGDGTYRLNGVEYIVPYGLWPRDAAPPVFMGQTLKREDTLQYWYLHVWAWLENPQGVFADFHPAVQCPASARRVYRPNPPAQHALP